MTKVDTGRVLIVGAGLGALYAALKLAPRPVLMISPEALGTGASSAWAQGGVAAAMGAGDSPQSHAADTVAAGAGTVDTDVAHLVTEEARAHILDLTSLGTPFDRTDDGGYVLSREAAHSFARVVRVKGDQAGAEIMATLVAEVRATPSVTVWEGAMAIGLEHDDDAVTGVIVQDASAPSAPVTLHGTAVLLAGGGSGGLWSRTTNPPRIRGQVTGMAARAGAVIADAEFVQFHPTAIDVGEDPAPLATEALRGEGAVLVNADGERFMQAVHPDGELAPRDVVARAIFAETQAGRRPLLDTRAALGEAVTQTFPAVAEACLRNGVDPARAPIPVTAAAHYHMGGVDTDADGRTSLPGLWACGEVTSTGLHGANRLASNGLLEALVFARRAALDITRALSAGPAETFAEAPGLFLSFTPGGTPTDETAVAELRALMTSHVGVLRDERGLTQALARIEELEAAHSDDPNFLNMTATATLVAATALIRKESRGAHARTDFPDPLPGPGQRSRLTLPRALDIRAQASARTA